MNALARALATAAADNKENPNILVLHALCKVVREIVASERGLEMGTKKNPSSKRIHALNKTDAALVNLMDALEDVEDSI